MELKNPIALLIALPLFIFAALFWFAPNNIVTGDTKYVISVIELCTACILSGFSFGRR